MGAMDELKQMIDESYAQLADAEQVLKVLQGSGQNITAQQTKLTAAARQLDSLMNAYKAVERGK